MSRRGLYTQKTKAQNVVYGPHVSTAVSHWKFEQLDSKFALDDEERAGNTPFVTKTWVKSTTAEILDDGADEKVKFLSFRPVVQTSAGVNANGLTANDIRGAVGGEAIPGIVTDTYSEDQLQSGTDQSVEPSEPLSVEASIEAEDTPTMDGDGDVIMD